MNLASADQFTGSPGLCLHTGDVHRKSDFFMRFTGKPFIISFL
jgi:hypothetical protein